VVHPSNEIRQYDSLKMKKRITGDELG
jgi:hypothetical protein